MVVVVVVVVVISNNVVRITGGLITAVVYADVEVIFVSIISEWLIIISQRNDGCGRHPVITAALVSADVLTS